MYLRSHTWILFEIEAYLKVLLHTKLYLESILLWFLASFPTSMSIFTCLQFFEVILSIKPLDWFRSLFPIWLVCVLLINFFDRSMCLVALCRFVLYLLFHFDNCVHVENTVVHLLFNNHEQLNIPIEFIFCFPIIKRGRGKEILLDLLWFNSYVWSQNWRAFVVILLFIHLCICLPKCMKVSLWSTHDSWSWMCPIPLVSVYLW